jgi:NTP pyrophosphatase (non-canonical NTP hydrolase)
MRKAQFEKITEWQKVTFNHATPLSKIAHLAEELQELVDALKNNDKGKVYEYADCFILLFGAAASDGMNYNDICKAIDGKMKINYKRKWGTANENGVVNHIK